MKKTTLSIIVIIVVALALFFIVKGVQTKNLQAAQIYNISQSLFASETLPIANKEFNYRQENLEMSAQKVFGVTNLGQGSTAPEVVNLQKTLNEIAMITNMPILNESGYGPETTAAVAKFQSVAQVKTTNIGILDNPTKIALSAYMMTLENAKKEMSVGNNTTPIRTEDTKYEPWGNNFKYWCYPKYNLVGKQWGFTCGIRWRF